MRLLTYSRAQRYGCNARMFGLAHFCRSNGIFAALHGSGGILSVGGEGGVGWCYWGDSTWEALIVFNTKYARYECRPIKKSRRSLSEK